MAPEAHLIDFDQVGIGLDLKKLALSLLLAAVVSISAGVERSFADADLPSSATSTQEVAESYALPITPPLHQGDTGLCWMYATLSMLETNYLVRHPGSRISLSRGAMQVEAVEDRLERLVRGESTKPAGRRTCGRSRRPHSQGRHGRAAGFPRHRRRDFRSPRRSKKTSPPFRIARPRKRRCDEEVPAKLGVVPEVTHLDGQVVSADQLAHAVTDGYEWTEFDLSPDGSESWGPSRDPDARPETRVKYVKLEVLIDLIHQSLARGQAVAWGSEDHAMLIYGADYDKDGKPLSYLIKDSFEPFTYRESADEIHKILHDVTVAR